MASRSTHLTGTMGKLLTTEAFRRLSGMLKTWRADPYYQIMERERVEGRILGFVKGLRLSAELIYTVRTILSTENLEVSWGHMLDKQGKSFSPECDVIIHKPGHLNRWNGHEKPVMDFKFIECTNALAVISCKSFLTSVDKEYCTALRSYSVKNTLLFAECCPTKSVGTLKRQARLAGYKGLWYLYTIDGESVIKEDENVYLNFIKTIKDILSPKNKPHAGIQRKKNKI